MTQELNSILDRKAAALKAGNIALARELAREERRLTELDQTEARVRHLGDKLKGRVA